MLSFKFLILMLNNVLTVPCYQSQLPQAQAQAQAQPQACVWIGHCLLSACQTEDDCDGELVCTGGVCSVDTDEASAINVTTVNDVGIIANETILGNTGTVGNDVGIVTKTVVDVLKGLDANTIALVGRLLNVLQRPLN